MRNFYRATALAAALALSACGGVTNTSALQAAEKADTEAANLYVAIVTTDASLVAAGKMTQATADRNKLTAWNLTVAVHQAYVTGQAIDLTALTALAQSVGAK